MRYEINLAGTDYGTGGGKVYTEFACEQSFLDGVANGCSDFETFMTEFADEVSGQFWHQWECDVDAVETGDLPADELEDERGFYVADSEPDMRIGVNHTHWGMSDTIALTSGPVVAEALREVLANYWSQYAAA